MRVIPAKSSLFMRFICIRLEMRQTWLSDPGGGYFLQFYRLLLERVNSNRPGRAVIESILYYYQTGRDINHIQSSVKPDCVSTWSVPPPSWLWCGSRISALVISLSGPEWRDQPQRWDNNFITGISEQFSHPALNIYEIKSEDWGARRCVFCFCWTEGGAWPEPVD